MKPPSAITAVGIGEPVVSIWLPGHPPGANQLQRMNRYIIGRQRGEWKRMTWIACREQLGTHRPMITPAVIHFRPVFEKHRRRDIDNMIAAYKPVIDGLVAAGVIPDDDIRTVKAIGVDPTVQKGSPGLHVEVYSTRNTP